MPVGALIGTTVIGVGSSLIGADAAGDAADAQSDAAYAAIDEQKAAREEMRQLLQPYVSAGNSSLQAQMNLLGLGEEGSQQAAIDELKNGDLFQSLLSQGSDTILQNASATGGIRGGNTQSALASYSSNLLNQVVNEQYNRLAGVTTLGQNSAAGVGASSQSTANSISELLSQAGSAQAGGEISQAKSYGSALSSLAGLGALF